MIIYKEPIKKQNMKHGGRFLSPCSFFAKQRKSTDHTDDTDLSCVGASEKVTQKSQKFLSTDHTENTECLG